MYNNYMAPVYSDELMHYGVLGMRWGVHRARHKLETHDDKIKKAQKYHNKAAKYQYKTYSGWTEDSRSRAAENYNDYIMEAKRMDNIVKRDRFYINNQARKVDEFLKDREPGSRGYEYAQAFRNEVVEYSKSHDSNYLVKDDI